MSKTDTSTSQVSPAQAAEEQDVADKRMAARNASPFCTLGFPVRFRAPEVHLTTTLRGGVELEGSIYHPELTEFAGTIGRLNDDGTADVALIIPGHSELRWVAGVSEGEDPGCFRPITD